MTFPSAVTLVNVSITATLDAASRQALVSAVDMTLSTPAGSTNYLSDSIVASAGGGQSRHLVTSSQETIKSKLQTTFALSFFPQYVGNTNALYVYLSKRLQDAVSSGNFTKILRHISNQDKISSNIEYSSCLNITVGTPLITKTESNPTNTATNSKSSSSSGSTLSTAELSIAVAVVVVGAFLIIMAIYAVVRHYSKLSAKYKQAMEITAASLDDVPYSYPAFSQEYFTQNDVDLDKLNYIADVAETKV